MRVYSLLVMLVASVMAPLALNSGMAQTDFAGKTITIVVGALPGSGFDMTARLVGHHIMRHLPDSPHIVNQSMPGGAHLVATNYVFNAANPDGTAILAANPSVALRQLFSGDGVQFDVREFEWLGSTGSNGVVFAIRADLPYDTFEEWKNSGELLKVASTGPGSSIYTLPLLLMEFTDAPIEIVPGYASGSDVMLAVERGEVEALAGPSSTIEPAANRGTVRPLVRTGATVAGFEDLPAAEDLATSELGRRVMALYGVPLLIGRAFALPPGTPEEIVSMWRDAFAEMVRDPEFLEEAQSKGVDVVYVAPEEIEEALDELMGQPADVVQAVMEWILKPKCPPKCKKK